jgi:hypothetical protein
MEGNYPNEPEYFESFYDTWVYQKTRYKNAISIANSLYDTLQSQLRQMIDIAIASYEEDYGDENPIIIDNITASPDYNVTLHFKSGCLIEAPMLDYLSGSLGGVDYELDGRNLIIPVKEPIVR